MATQTPTQDPTKARLDHIILLLPHADLLNLPQWLTKNFTITPGGRHADNKTENKLILFHDGSYIELIAFISDSAAHKENHWWGAKQPGIIDYALTTTGSATSNWEGVQQRLSKLNTDSGIRYAYAPPVAGGRRRDDGVEVKWEVTFPKDVERGQLPFYCHDVTPRDRRVPFSEEACTHPCGAYGVKRLGVHVPGGKAEELEKVYSAVLDQVNLSNEEGVACFAVETVRGVERAELPRVYVQKQGGKEGGPSGEGQEVLLGDLVLGAIAAPGSTTKRERLDVETDYGNIVLETSAL